MAKCCKLISLGKEHLGAFYYSDKISLSVELLKISKHNHGWQYLQPDKVKNASHGFLFYDSAPFRPTLHDVFDHSNLLTDSFKNKS